MVSSIERIGAKDLVWSYLSTFLSLGTGVILWPFILHYMSAETVAIWNIFQTVTGLVLLLDMGFKNTFSRNISYVFSGVQHLRVEGVEKAGTEINYILLKELLGAIKKFYRNVAVIVLLFLCTIGNVYFYHIVQKFTGDRVDAIVAWVLLIFLNIYNLYTYYYEALLTGKGFVKKNQQITILSQSVYLLVAVVMIVCGANLTAVVVGQLAAILLRRFLSYSIFFTKDLRAHLQIEGSIINEKEVFQTIAPNAIKIGLTSLGGFLIGRASLLIGTAILPLSELACYGLTIQVIEVIGRCGSLYYQTYLPKIAQCNAHKDISSLRKYYLYSVLCLFFTFFAGMVVCLCFGNKLLYLIGSETLFLSSAMLCVMFCFNLLEQNHAIAAGFLMSRNVVPFFIPSLLSALGTIILLFLFEYLLNLGLWGLILAPGIVQLVYQNWKWPKMIISELWGKNSNAN